MNGVKRSGLCEKNCSQKEPSISLKEMRHLYIQQYFGDEICKGERGGLIKYRVLWGFSKF